MAEDLRRFTQVRTLCEGALELPRTERHDWLLRMCEGDAELYAEVEDLLRRVDEGGRLAELLSDEGED